MAGHTPLQTVEQLIEAFHAGDVEAALALYEPEGTLVVAPGNVARGAEALRTAIEGFIALAPTMFTDSYEIIEVKGLALYCSRWRLNGTAPDGSKVQEVGESADVLRRASDGTWRIAIDNPWGAALLKQHEENPG